MQQGTYELALFGVAFLALQFWWLRMTIKNGNPESVMDIHKDTLNKQKNRLEKLLKKQGQGHHYI